MIKEIAYAKINLALEVKNKVDGYHLVNNLMAPIDLYDELFFENCDTFIFDSSIDIEDNICVKAYNEFVKETGINKGVRIVLKKNIPTCAGLAGGSTDAAAVIKGLNRLFDTKLSIEKMESICSRLGSDVPFFIKPGLSLCTNRGEIVNHLDIKFKNIDIILVKPSIGLSTKLVYQNYIYDGISKEDKINNIIEALKDNDLEALKNNIFNDLSSVSRQISEELKNIYDQLNKNNKIYISGSGPTMFMFDYNSELEKLDSSVFVKRCRIIGE